MRQLLKGNMRSRSYFLVNKNVILSFAVMSIVLVCSTRMIHQRNKMVDEKGYPTWRNIFAMQEEGWPCKGLQEFTHLTEQQLKHFTWKQMFLPMSRRNIFLLIASVFTEKWQHFHLLITWSWKKNFKSLEQMKKVEKGIQESESGVRKCSCQVGKRLELNRHQWS